VARQIGVGDVIGATPGWGMVLRRGLGKRCPRCGGKGVYDSWFRMKDRCPTCGYRFEREPGFFVGAYLINFAIAEGLLFVLVMGFVFWKNSRPDAGVAVPIALAVVVSIVAPMLFYPYSRTIWSAIDLVMTPLELREIVDAAEAVDDEGDGPVDGGPPTG
jgi:uncharacterized protein (DUF983 family)